MDAKVLTKEERAEWLKRGKQLGQQYEYDRWEATLQAAEAERDALKSKLPYAEASGHYCDGMTAAWSDAQDALGQLAASQERELVLREALRYYGTEGGTRHRNYDDHGPGPEVADAALAAAPVAETKP